jgi:hypothetical protein
LALLVGLTATFLGLALLVGLATAFLGLALLVGLATLLLGTFAIVPDAQYMFRCVGARRGKAAEAQRRGSGACGPERQDHGRGADGQGGT